MLYFLVYVILFFTAAVLQTSVIPRIEIFGAQPSFLLILTIMIAIRHGSLAGCFVGFMSGLLCDVYAPIEWFGAYSFSYCIVGFAVGQIEESFINLNLIPKIIVLAAAGFIKDLIYFACIEKNFGEVIQSFISISIPNNIYTICVGAIFFYIVSLRTEKKIEVYR